MTITSAWLLLLGGILIGAGFTLIVRDRGRTPHNLARRTDGRTSATDDPAGAFARAKAPVVGVAHAEGETARAGPERMGPSLAQQWALLAPLLEAAVADTNALLAPERLALGASRAADWSYRQRGYGAHRRLLLAGDSIAWLRLELTAEGSLQANVKAHDEKRAAINASAERAAAGVTSQQVTELLLACLRPVAGTAAQARAGTDGGWQQAYGTILSALRATNGALAVAGARIVPMYEEAPPPIGAGALSLRVEADGDDLARVSIAVVNGAVEVAVDPCAARPAELARRRRVPLDGVTIYALAESIAGCAWPAIAHHASARPGLSA